MMPHRRLWSVNKKPPGTGEGAALSWGAPGWLYDLDPGAACLSSDGTAVFEAWVPHVSPLCRAACLSSDGTAVFEAWVLHVFPLMVLGGGVCDPLLHVFYINQTRSSGLQFLEYLLTSYTWNGLECLLYFFY